MEALTPPRRRAGDGRFAFQVLPFIVTFGTERHTLSSADAQILLTELGRLPHGRYPLAETAAERLGAALSRGWAAAFTPVEEPTVLRALESVRVRRRLPVALAALREGLVRRITGLPAA